MQYMQLDMSRTTAFYFLHFSTVLSVAIGDLFPTEKSIVNHSGMSQLCQVLEEVEMLRQDQHPDNPGECPLEPAWSDLYTHDSIAMGENQAYI